MISVLIIGLGRFGRHMAIKFQEQGNDVMAVEKDETRADEMAPVIQNIQIGDATNEDFLQSLGVGNYDVCVVGIGESFHGPGDHGAFKGSGGEVCGGPGYPGYL